MPKNRRFKEQRYGMDLPVIAAIPDAGTQTVITELMQDLEQLKPGFIEEVHEPIVKIISAHTIAEPEASPHIDLTIEKVLQHEGLTIQNGVLTLEFKDTAWMRDAACMAISAMQRFTGSRELDDKDWNYLHRVNDTAIALARVNSCALGSDAEYFTKEARLCIDDWYINQSNTMDFEPRRPTVPESLGFTSLRLVRINPEYHIPKSYTPYLRAPSTPFNIELEKERIRDLAKKDKYGELKPTEYAY